MRWLLWIAVWVGIVWCAWWGFAAWSLSSGVERWFDDRRAQGWQAELAGTSVTGFPMRVESDLEAPVLADPNTGLALSSDTLRLGARTLWPGDMFVALPDTPIRIATPQGRGSVGFDAGRADLNLHPGASLELELLSFTSGPMQALRDGQTLFSAEAVTLGAAQSIETPEIYGIDLKADRFAPGDIFRRDFAIPDTWPLVFEALNFNASLTFDRPWDRRALEDSRPQPVRVDLHQARAVWGDLQFLAVGDLDVDSAGVPTGSVTIKAENWEAMLDIAETAGLFPGDTRALVQNVLRSLSANTGRTNALDLTLTFRDGLVRVGFLPLGPAPRLIIR